MGEEHSEVSKNRFFILEKQKVIVNNIDTSGLILDIGGGGEGIIGQMKGKQVVAIDPNKKELDEAADRPLKIIMEAGDMLFLDNAFDVVTSFFTLMYIKGSEHEKIFKVVFRVLVSGGRFLIWDMDLPQCLDEEKDIVAFYLNIKLPDREIETGYGTKWPEQRQGLPYYKEKAERVGFTVSNHKKSGQVFYLESQKP